MAPNSLDTLQTVVNAEANEFRLPGSELDRLKSRGSWMNTEQERTVFESWNMGKSVSKGTLYGETFVVGFKFFFSQINFEIEQITSNYVRRKLLENLLISWLEVLDWTIILARIILKSRNPVI